MGEKWSRKFYPKGTRVAAEVGATKYNFRSKAELSVATHLLDLGVDFDFEKHRINYTIEKKYISDFSWLAKDGHRIYLEVKGWMPATDRAKYVALKKSAPLIDLRFLFMRAEMKLRKGAKSNYGDWADKHGFQWADKSLPLSWTRGE